MPELPEVETLRRGLERHLRHRRIIAAEVMGPRTIRRHEPDKLHNFLVGNLVSACGRHGKYLIVSMENGVNMVIHLRMTGRLEIVRPPFLGDAKHLHARFILDNGSELLFFDPRTFGEIFISEKTAGKGLPEELSSLGPDSLSQDFTLGYFTKVAKKREVAVKGLLLEQETVAGIGNIYGDEICHEAGVLPMKKASLLTDGELSRLHKAVGGILSKAVEHKGSTLSDKKYLDITGSEGTYQYHHKVYSKAGMPCESCGDTIVRTKVTGRSCHYCPTCQK